MFHKINSKNPIKSTEHRNKITRSISDGSLASSSAKISASIRSIVDFMNKNKLFKLSTTCQKLLVPNRKKLLCSGKYGRVYEAMDNWDYVIKVIKRADDDSSLLMEEHPLLIKISQGHPNLHPIEETIWQPSLCEYWIIMKKLQGCDLFDFLEKIYLKNHRAPPEVLVIGVAKQVLNALVYLHNNGIIHRDVKLENIRIILSNENILDSMQVILYDYGLSEFMYNRRGDISGTKEYIAPEIYLTDKKYDGRADVWSLGITLYTMMTGKTPFEYLKIEHNQFGYLRNKEPLRIGLTNNGYSNKVIDLCFLMLEIDENKRLSAKKLLNLLS